tara:strand:+ start:2944 stop:5982 length:3039 start_codon:yes stop_codon:yes gene_type:complete
MISIEILDYIYSSDVNNQFSLNNATTVDDWTIDSSSEASITTVSGSTQALEPVTGNLTEGVLYDISLTVSGYSGTGDIGFGVSSVDGTTIGISSAMRLSANGTVSETFTALATNNVKILAEVGSAGTITASLTPASSIDFSKSIVGSLDIANSVDFPLALTFAVSDIRKLDARTGTYSKTFNIPATKNNNNIFRGAYHEGSYIEGNKISTEKTCRILVDNNYSITGKIQVTAIGKSSSPSYYSCVFYGNNVDWASSLDSKLLKDLRESPSSTVDGSGWDNLNRKGAGTGTGLLIQKDEIVATWGADNALLTTPQGGAQTTNVSPVVYPIVSYGEYNEGGDAGTIQLLRQRDDTAGKYGYKGWDNSNNPYGNPTPSCDWRPCVFIYDVIKQIFIQEGYTITSNFIETASFKKLLMALPNFRYNNVEERTEGADSNTWEGTFFIEGPVPPSTGYIQNVSFVTAATPSNSWVYTTQDIVWSAGSQLVQHDNTTIYDGTSSFLITEYGLYNIALDDVGIYLNSTCYSTYTATNIGIGYIAVRVMVKAVGQTSWNKIGEAYILGEGTSYVPYPTCGSLTAGSQRIDNLLIEDYYLNKGDTIKFEYRTKAKHFNSGNQTIGIEADLFGGTNIDNMAASGGVSNRSGRVSIQFQGDFAQYGQTYDLKNVIDSESTQVGFLKGVSHAFNLQFLTNTVARTVEIEPYNDFYKDESLALDWTDKVDFSQIQEDKFIQTDLAREIIFKYKEDSNDKKVEARALRLWSGIIDEYPYREFLSTEFAAGKAVFKNPFFAGTYNGRDSQTYLGSENEVPYNALLWGMCDTTPPSQPYGAGTCRPPKGYDYVPRLLNWERMSCSSTPTEPPNIYRQKAEVQEWLSENETIYSTPFTAPKTYEIYPKATSYDKFNSSTEVLCYNTINTSDWDCSTGSYGTYSYQKGLYQNYYQFMIEQIKSTPRLKTIYLNLKLDDISNLDLRKLVYVNGYYYRINQIVDFQPNNNKTTKVELLLWENKGGFLAYPAEF